MIISNATRNNDSFVVFIRDDPFIFQLRSARVRDGVCVCTCLPLHSSQPLAPGVHTHQNIGCTPRQHVLRSHLAPHPRSSHFLSPCRPLVLTVYWNFAEKQCPSREAGTGGPRFLQGAGACSAACRLHRKLIQMQGNLTNIHSAKFSGIANAKVRLWGQVVCFCN